MTLLIECVKDSHKNSRGYSLDQMLGHSMSKANAGKSQPNFQLILKNFRGNSKEQKFWLWIAPQEIIACRVNTL